MFFERFYDTDLAQASYMVGCQKTGECLVIDPVRHIQPYLDKAAEQKLRITHVTETHIHADFLSGSRELASRTGASLYLSAEGGPDWQYQYEHHALHHGDVLTVGNLRLEVRHTPGHTPEHLAFLLTDQPRGDTPVMLFSGDFVFVGDVGRPDLLDEAVGGKDTRFVGAQQIFTSLREVFLSLPDHIQVWPGHGSGSACGKSLGAVPSTTVGYERATAWWSGPVMADNIQGFTDELLSGQPDAPLYYGRMKTQNRAGPALLAPASPLPRLTPDQLSGLTLIDTRPRQEHQANEPQGSISLPAGNTLETWAGWLLRPKNGPYALLADELQAQIIRQQLWMVGLDDVVGYLPTTAAHDSALKARPAPLLSAQALDKVIRATKTPVYILDVRSKNEYQAGHLPSGQQLHAGRLAWSLSELRHDLPKDGGLLVVHCQSGARSNAAASFLRAQGFEAVELAGGFESWTQYQQTQPQQTQHPEQTSRNPA